MGCWLARTKKAHASQKALSVATTEASSHSLQAWSCNSRVQVKYSLHMFNSLLFMLACATSLFAQPPQESDYTIPFPPHRIVANVYYVGSKGLASYLITTPEGHILINSSFESSVPLIREAIENLRFRFSDVKILLISHAHSDHNAGSALVKELTGAKYMVMDGDVPDVQAGGKGNFQYGKSPDTFYKPTVVDRVLHDGDEVRLGDVVLVAHLTPGHTKGCTTWTMRQ